MRIYKNKTKKSPPQYERGLTNAGIAEVVLRQLEEDYKEKYLGWILAAHWEGPVNVPLDHINTTNRRNWAATEDLEHVKDFLDQVKDGSVKPIILVNEPNNDKMIICDGHHRYLASEELNMPVRAYIANVGGVGGDWRKMHDEQNNHGESKQESNQIGND